MALSDLMLKAKVNLALVRDPRISPLDIGVQANDGVVTLTGDVDIPEKARAAEDAARRVEGVKAIENRITLGEGTKQSTVDFVRQRFLNKLDEEWNDLPEETALAQADYVQWAAWMIHKFRIPDTAGGDVAEGQSKATDEAIRQVARRISVSPAIMALEVMRIADRENMRDAGMTRLEHADLVTTPVVTEGNTELAA